MTLQEALKKAEVVLEHSRELRKVAEASLPQDARKTKRRRRTRTHHVKALSIDRGVLQAYCQAMRVARKMARPWIRAAFAAN